ncbi:hypothetical protein DFH08DRAFT_802215 [Mycena albidolilacea]|uniref:Uncharacterized protein n=1 Tax=Mycena albidolilacea TaxID=1033008 RepID=A0AAD7AI70_9AGAR|nr:hypothetical protein DFH08DRAFT_802215 [Mycena albidolilacea]
MLKIKMAPTSCAIHTLLIKLLNFEKPILFAPMGTRGDDTLTSELTKCPASAAYLTLSGVYCLLPCQGTVVDDLKDEIQTFNDIIINPLVVQQLQGLLNSVVLAWLGPETMALSGLGLVNLQPKPKPGSTCKPSQTKATGLSHGLGSEILQAISELLELFILNQFSVRIHLWTAHSLVPIEAMALLAWLGFENPKPEARARLSYLYVWLLVVMPMLRGVTVAAMEPSYICSIFPLITFIWELAFKFDLLSQFLRPYVRVSTRPCPKAAFTLVYARLHARTMDCTNICFMPCVTAGHLCTGKIDQIVGLPAQQREEILLRVVPAMLLHLSHAANQMPSRL